MLFLFETTNMLVCGLLNQTKPHWVHKESVTDWIFEPAKNPKNHPQGIHETSKFTDTPNSEGSLSKLTLPWTLTLEPIWNSTKRRYWKMRCLFKMIVFQIPCCPPGNCHISPPVNSKTALFSRWSSFYCLVGYVRFPETNPILTPDNGTSIIWRCTVFPIEYGDFPAKSC